MLFLPIFEEVYSMKKNLFYSLLFDFLLYFFFENLTIIELLKIHFHFSQKICFKNSALLCLFLHY